jgi:hypothetical protein
VEEDGEVARLIVGRIVHIFLIFSQAESHVKDLVADRMILKRKSPFLLLTIVPAVLTRHRRPQRPPQDGTAPPDHHAQVH